MARAAALPRFGPDQLLSLLRVRQREWRQRYQLQRIGLFGSTARKRELEELLQRPVDLVRLRPGPGVDQGQPHAGKIGRVARGQTGADGQGRGGDHRICRSHWPAEAEAAMQQVRLPVGRLPIEGEYPISEQVLHQLLPATL